MLLVFLTPRQALSSHLRQQTSKFVGYRIYLKTPQWHFKINWPLVCAMAGKVWARLRKQQAAQKLRLLQLNSSTGLLPTLPRSYKSSIFFWEIWRHQKDILKLTDLLVCATAGKVWGRLLKQQAAQKLRLLQLNSSTGLLPTLPRSYKSLVSQLCLQQQQQPLLPPVSSLSSKPSSYYRTGSAMVEWNFIKWLL